MRWRCCAAVLPAIACAQGREPGENAYAPPDPFLFLLAVAVFELALAPSQTQAIRKIPLPACHLIRKTPCQIIRNTTPDLAKKNRNFLRSVYSVIKSCDQHIRFSLITGVSKFSRVSLFSSLNDLDLDRIRECYNTSRWGDDERLYNPYDVLTPLQPARLPSLVVRARPPLPVSPPLPPSPNTLFLPSVAPLSPRPLLRAPTKWPGNFRPI